jgi:hypothetical protein
MKLSSLNTLIIGCFLGTSLLSYSTAAQKKDDKRVSPLCNRQSGLRLIQEQLPLTKTFADVASRIRVLLRAADLLWPYRNEESRAAFTEALDLAIQDHKEKGDGTRREGIGLMAEVPDQRYTVIAAIGKRDVAWARKLSDQILDEDAKENNARDNPDSESPRRTNEKLLTLALGFLSSDETSAINYARVSLRYPASLMLPIFLFKMAELNRARADLFYEEALAAYAAKAMEQFLYLSAYPFANTRDVGEMPGWTIYRLPEGFNASPRLERLFVQRLLTNAQSILATPIEATATDNNDLSEAAQMWLALTRLENQIQSSLPDMAEAASQARGNLFSLLPQRSQTSVSGLFEARNHPTSSLSFDEQVEAADKQAKSEARERNLALAVMNAPRSESLEHVLAVADRISDVDLKNQVVSLLYFFRAQQAIKDRRIDDARKLALKVTEIDRRAYLDLTMAETLLKQGEDQSRAREILEEVTAAVKKAPSTIVTARALLGLAALYARIDVNRSIELLGDAVNCINRLETPDFSSQYVQIKVEGKDFGFYTGFQTPGFNPENAFRDVSKQDFDGVLYQAANFADKPLRALTTIAVVEPCLQQVAKPKKKQRA